MSLNIHFSPNAGSILIFFYPGSTIVYFVLFIRRDNHLSLLFIFFQRQHLLPPFLPIVRSECVRASGECIEIITQFLSDSFHSWVTAARVEETPHGICCLGVKACILMAHVSRKQGSILEPNQVLHISGSISLVQAAGEKRIVASMSIVWDGISKHSFDLRNTFFNLLCVIKYR